MHEHNIHRTKLAEATLASQAEIHLERLKSEASIARTEKEAKDAELAKTNQLVNELREKVAHLTAASSYEIPRHTPIEVDQNEVIIQDLYNQLNAEKVLADKRAKEAQENTKKLIEDANQRAEERTKAHLSHLEKMMFQMIETVKSNQNAQSIPPPAPVINIRGRSPQRRVNTNSDQHNKPSTIDMLFKRNAGSSTVTINETKTTEPPKKPVVIESGGGDPDDDPEDDDDPSDDNDDDEEPPKKDDKERKDDKRVIKTRRTRRKRSVRRKMIRTTEVMTEMTTMTMTLKNRSRRSSVLSRRKEVKRKQIT
jgi:hypothetical protein